MPLHTFSPITFLSGLSAGWSPINPTGKSAGWSPINPTGKNAGWSPINPTGKNAGWSPIGPGRAHPVSSLMAVDPQALAGWEGVDPDWVYAEADSLLGQALRKSRAKISRLSDPVALDAALPPDSRDPKAVPLWRWAPEFRVAAVVCELLGRVQVHGRSLWLLNPPASVRKKAGSNPFTATPLYELPAHDRRRPQQRGQCQAMATANHRSLRGDRSSFHEVGLKQAPRGDHGKRTHGSTRFPLVAIPRSRPVRRGVPIRSAPQPPCPPARRSGAPP